MKTHDAALCFLYFPPCHGTDPVTGGPCGRQAEVWPRDPDGAVLQDYPRLFCRPCGGRWAEAKPERFPWTLAPLHAWSAESCIAGDCPDCRAVIPGDYGGYTVALCALHRSAAEAMAIVREVATWRLREDGLIRPLDDPADATLAAARALAARLPA